MTIQRVTCSDKGDYGLDEIVADKVHFHIERKSCGHFWFLVEDRTRRVTVNLYQEGRKIVAHVEEERNE